MLKKKKKKKKKLSIKFSLRLKIHVYSYQFLWWIFFGRMLCHEKNELQIFWERNNYLENSKILLKKFVIYIYTSVIILYLILDTWIQVKVNNLNTYFLNKKICSIDICYVPHIHMCVYIYIYIYVYTNPNIHEVKKSF